MASKIGDSSMSLSRLRRDGPSGGVRFGRHRGARPPAGRSGAQARAAGGWVRMAALTWGYVTSTLSRAKQNRRLGSTRAFPAATVAMNSCNLGGVPHILVSDSTASRRGGERRALPVPENETGWGLPDNSAGASRGRDAQYGPARCSAMETALDRCAGAAAGHCDGRCRCFGCREWAALGQAAEHACENLWSREPEAKPYAPQFARLEMASFSATWITTWSFPWLCVWRYEYSAAVPVSMK
eukprot:scaffold2741_cov134-Isochrysis_galbana.AAC.3